MVIERFEHPAQSFRSCFGIIKLKDRYGCQALEQCCDAAVLAGKCNYSYVVNTIASFVSEPSALPAPSESHANGDDKDVKTGTYKDDDTRYSLDNLLRRNTKEGRR